MNNIVTRSLSGAVYVALIVCSILLWQSFPWLFFVCFLALMLEGMRELDNLAFPGEVNWLFTALDMVTAGLLFTLFFIISQGFCGSGIVLLLLMLALVGRFTASLYSRKANVFKSLARISLALVYVALPLSLLNFFSVCPRMLLLVFVLLWVNDTGAYLVGCSIGRHRLFERISPKKSWEGFWGGVTASVAVSVIAGTVLASFFEVPCIACAVGLGVIVPVMGTAGDLVESLMKRTAGVKDSSHVIPGHGGVLDRIDSLLLTAPIALAFVLLFI